MKKIYILLTAGIIFFGCKPSSHNENNPMMKKVNQYAEVTLTADISLLHEDQKEMLKLFIQVADIMDEIFWVEAYGDKNALLDTISDENLKKFTKINYGPWERLNGDKPFVESIGNKPEGANFYPTDMTIEEFEAFADPEKTSQYTLLRRDESGNLICIPYHVAFAEQIQKVSELLKQAALLAKDDDFRTYLELRARAFQNDDYQASDMAWMDMKNNLIDFVVGPIENYEDQLFGYKAAHEAFILLKDKAWSERLDKYAALLPALQQKLPVEPKYKTESPGSNSDLAAYDALYYSGDCNSGGKTIAINLPNDEEVQLKKGSRRLQLKNSMQAKFEKILLPIARELIVEEQQRYITFDAFFENVMFHEVAHGLGIKNTINNTGTVRESLKDQYTTLEEGKADILALFLVAELKKMGELDVDLMENYTTFLAGIFRSIRFGSSSAHGKANLVRFNYFKEKGAFKRNEQGKYAVDFEKMQLAIQDLSREIIVIQGDGNYTGAEEMVKKYGIITSELEQDLNLIESKSIPVDIVFLQGPEFLAL
ncbi:MAG: Zn-dependent hydrolase [Bacteroidales bacterium]|nr:Zn-dependent hydrolase [Bacteroidales bacterium]